MKTYQRFRTPAELFDLAQQQGVEYSAKNFREGSDYLMFRLPGPDGICSVLFGTHNGRFFCADEGFSYFNSGEQHDGKPWFDALLDFFYTNEGTSK